MSNQIFVSVASYRDKELVPTILDCVAKSKYPQNLHFGIHSQKDECENLDLLDKIPNISIEECDWRESKGACWARSNIQKKLYNGQKFYLQLDSHHRFIPDWDETLLKLYDESLLLSPKPIIGTYGTTYWPQKNEPLKNEPYRINTFDSFGSDGDIISRPVFIKNHHAISQTRNLIKARLLSGHFIFCDASFINECPYDPNLYFRGEELTLSVRAFTYGYDFYHPTKTIIWHEYLRPEAPKHWLDHIKSNGFVQEGEDRNVLSKKRQRKLLGIENCDIDFKNYGLGDQRSLHEYELYAGLDFKNQRVHKLANDVREEHLEPYMLTESEWDSGMLKKYNYNLELPTHHFPDRDDYNMIFLGFETHDGKLLSRKEIKDNKYLKKLTNKINLEINAEVKPSKCVVMMLTNNGRWTEKISIGV